MSSVRIAGLVLRAMGLQPSAITLGINMRAFLSAIVGLVVVAIGCGDDTGLVCGDGTVRQGGRCVAADSGVAPVDAGEPPPGLSCGAGTIAVRGECVAVDAGAAPQLKKPVGEACVSNDECATGTCAPEADNLPGGYCTILNCGEDNPCPVGSTCYASTLALSLCMAYCDADTECRTDEDYHCQPLYTTGLNICAPSCTLTSACTSGTTCNADTGLCELAECEVDEADQCADDETCWPDSRGLSSTGGLCLRLCDPDAPEDDCKVLEKGEVCQPLAEDPANTGFCAPPVCTTTEDCPAGAVCADQVCQPPALCDDDGECADDSTTCVSGKCMTKCPTGKESCEDIHSGLVCADVLDEPACLPLGSFPGSGCRDSARDACDDVTVGDATAPMVCQDGLCLVDCSSGGSELCGDVDDNLVCAVGIFDDDLCLPKGAFPGAPCGPSDSCAQDLDGNAAIDMQCVDGTCVVGCAEDTKYPGYGDALCELLDPALTCSATAGDLCVYACDEGSCATGYSCFDVGAPPDEENACLPNGSFPGSACATGNACDQDLGGNTAIDQVCVDGTCVISCDTAGDATVDDGLCAGVDASLTCSESADDICVIGCVSGQCLPGYSCLDPGEENACLPTGSFPGSPCATGDTCAQDLGGNTDVDMVCSSGTCVVDCDTAGDATVDDGLCAGVDASLTCSESADDICVIGCVAGECLTGYSCLDPAGENACLPDGSFPGSACGAGDSCAQDLGGNTDADMVCSSGTCVVDCDTAGDATVDDGLCAGVDSSLTCAESAGDVCVIGCVAGACPTGYSCLDPGGENACLPDGTFPGSACGAGDSCAQDLGGNTSVDMFCSSGTCVVDCDTAGDATVDDGLCAGVDSSLTCAESAGDVCVIGCVAGACPTGYSCLDAGGENACLPNGTFPGSACGAGDSCAQDLGGNTSVDMVCSSGTCLVDCDTAGDATVDDGLCAGVDASLTCAESAGDLCVIGCVAGACPTGYSCLDAGGENACLPNGSFPGSACGASNSCAQDLGGNSAVDMECVSGTCAVSCPGDNDALCAGVDTSLTCSESASDICVLACEGGACASGYSCLDPGGEDACLPDGTFPGSACRAAEDDRCDQNLGGLEAADMVCVDQTCVVACPSDNDPLCAAVDASLTCSESAGNLCVLACDTGACPSGYSCLDPGGENACLPDGTFPGSTCRSTVGDECDQDLGGDAAVDMECAAGNVCAVSCPSNNDALCQGVDPGLTCSVVAGDICVVACVGAGNACPPGYSCFVAEDACFPN